ncbi:MAG: MvdC/MvdD family ATP grasp protein [Myxococcota bacterium]
MDVLIITRTDDNDCIGMVSEELRRRGARPIRLDTDRYPQDVRISTRVGGDPRVRRMVTSSDSFDLGSLGAVWYRRFFAGGRLPAALGDTRPACVEESRRTLYGTIAASGCFEMDPLVAVRKTDHKELQLKRAHELGLEVPRTLFTNDVVEARAFHAELGGNVITKMQSSFAIYRDGRELVVFTTPVKAEDLQDAEGLRYCPMTFQELLPKRLELRATVVGRRVLTASIDSQKSEKTQVDWRRDGMGLLNDWQPYTLPAHVEAALLRLTADFGLNYAAADFVVTPEGRHVFLEINAGGEWFWLQRAPGLPIAASIAEVLLGQAERAVTVVK